MKTNPLRRAIPHAAAALAALGALGFSPPCAAACSFPPPGRVRTSIPGDGDTDVPTSIRPRVSYRQGAWAEAQCGAPAPAPVIRRLVPGDGGAAPPVDGGAPGLEVPGAWVPVTEDDPRNGSVWEFRPQSPLPPHSTYALIDAFPADCPCDTGGCKPQAVAVFARFTTGDTADTTPPFFSGLVGAFCTRDACAAGDDTCCGPYNHFSFHFVDAGDAEDDHLVGLRLYARKDGAAWDFTHPVGPLVLTDPTDSPLAPRWDLALTPGIWHVIARAFDSSGNEDGNMKEVQFTMPLASSPECIKVVIDGGPPPLDMSFMFTDLAHADAGADAGDAEGVSTGACSLGGRRRLPDGTLVLLALALPWAWWRRRGRRRR